MKACNGRRHVVEYEHKAATTATKKEKVMTISIALVSAQLFVAGLYLVWAWRQI